MATIKLNSGQPFKPVTINKPGQPSASINKITPVVNPLRIIKTISRWSGDADTNNQRLPSVLVFSDTQARVFFTQRNSSIGAGDGQGMRLVSKLVTVDPVLKTITAGATEIIEQPAGWTEGLDITTNCVFRKLQTGPNAGRVVMLMNRNTNGTGISGPTLIYSVFVMFSDDNGATWTTPVQVLAGSSGNYQAMGGNGDMVELMTGDHVGRLIAPLYTPTFKHAFISDDYGITWYKSTGVSLPTQASEPTMAICNDGTTLLMTIRNDSAPYTRYQTKSTDGGVTWSSPETRSDLAGPACNASTYGDGEKIILSGPSHSGLRMKSRIRRTTDNGTNWTDYYKPIPENQNFGYSCARPMGDDLLFIAFESNTIAQQGFNIDEHIKVLVVNQKEIDNWNNPPAIIPATNAQQYYDAYESRVLTDGGVITDSIATLEAIQFALDYSIGSKTPVALSARWGVKTSGGNLIKLYSLFDTAGDATVAGSGNDFYSINTDLSFARIATPTLIGTKYLKTSAFTPLTASRFGAAISGIAPSGGIQAIRMGIEDSDTSPVSWQITTQSVQANIKGGDDVFTGFGTIQNYADNSAMVSVADQDGGVMYQYTDGVEIVTAATIRALVAKYGELTDFKSMNRELLIGARKQGEVYFGSQSCFFNEIWWISDITDVVASALSTRLMIYQ